ncbi:TPA: GAF domain-containing protein, partial [Candidatus Poribacteria bacterium]|nr:GAF domain-containing protein [Candidatus Poribacteria bacterium]
MEEGNVIRTLLIEGDLGNAGILREMLAGSSFGRFELIHCQRFEIGMSRLAGGDIDVVLLDLSLQDIDGFEALSQLRSQMPQVPVVALGEVDDRAIALRALEGGAQDYWVKDKIVADLMIRSLRYAIERHRSQMRAEQSRRDERLIRANRSWKMLSECNQALIWASDESNLLDEICRIVVETGGYRMAWIGYAEHDGEKTVKPMAQKGFDDGYLESVKITWDESETGRGPTGTAIRTGAPCLIRDILHDPSYRPWRSEAIRRGYQSSIALPLIAEERVLGTLNIYATEPDAFDEDEVALLMRLADN